MNKPPIIVFYILALLCSILPVVLIKKYINTNNIHYLWISMFLYFLLMVSYVKIFKTGEMSTLYTIIQMLQIPLVVLVGFLFFGEHIKILGMVFALIAIYLLKV